MININQECKCTHRKGEHKSFLKITPTKCKICKCDDFMKKDYNGRYELVVGMIYIIFAGLMSFVYYEYAYSRARLGFIGFEEPTMYVSIGIAGLVLFGIICLKHYKKVKHRQIGIVE